MRLISIISERSYALIIECLFLIYICVTLTSGALIVPKELPSILSVVYSNIPPIKKGTDSRLGFGFRLGEHADLQILVELGPQTETRPIGNQNPPNTLSKRQVNENKKILIVPQQNSSTADKNTWLEKWSGEVEKTKLIKKELKIPTKPYVPDEKIKQLQRLYKMATSTETITEVDIGQSVTNSLSPVQLEKRLKSLRAHLEKGDLQILKESKAEVIKELMDINLDE